MLMSEIMNRIINSIWDHVRLSAIHGLLHVGGDKDKTYKVIVSMYVVLAAVGLPLLMIILTKKNVMSENVLIIMNLIGLLVFCSIGLGVGWLIDEWHWNSKGCESSPFIGFGLLIFSILLWAGVMMGLTLTMWKTESTATYAISISW